MSGSSSNETASTSGEQVDRPCSCRTESFRFCPCYSTHTWQRGDPTTGLPTAPVWRPSQYKRPRYDGPQYEGPYEGPQYDGPQYDGQSDAA